MNGTGKILLVIVAVEAAKYYMVKVAALSCTHCIKGAKLCIRFMREGQLNVNVQIMHEQCMYSGTSEMYM